MKTLSILCLAIGVLGSTSLSRAQCGGTVQVPHVVFNPVTGVGAIGIGSVSGEEAYLFVPDTSGTVDIRTTSSDLDFKLWLCENDSGVLIASEGETGDSGGSELTAYVSAGVEYRLYRQRTNVLASDNDVIAITVPAPFVTTVSLDSDGDAFLTDYSNDPATDGDYFKYTAPSSGSLSVVADDADNSPSYDTDLFVFDESGSLVFSDTGGFDDGDYSGTVFAGEVLYFLVRSDVSAHNTGNYTLSVSGPPVPLPNQATTPNPTDYASGVSTMADLSWVNGGAAASYHVYFGTSNPPPFRGNTASTTYDPGTLNYSTIYYWRVDSVNVTGTTSGTLWRFTTAPPPPPGQATSPTPSNNATDVPVNADVSWHNGGGATGYSVYFGTSNPPPYQGNTAFTTFNPGTLNYSTTYFWRIDSINVGGRTNGTLWKFTTQDPPPPDQATTPSPSDDAGGVSTTADLSWHNGGGATSYNVYFGTSNPPPSRGNTPSTTYDPGTLSYSTDYYWRIDSVNAGGTTTGALWHFVTRSAPPPPPQPATNPNPSDHADDVSVTTGLSWSNGGGATQYRVQFGTTDPPPTVGTQSLTTYDPGTLAYDTTYFWRIDSLNSGGTTLGDLWTFTTGSPPPPNPTTHPTPSDGADDVSVTTDLRWDNGGGATSFDVYFGISDSPPFIHNQTDTTFDPGTLAYDTTYYWHVEAVGPGGTVGGTTWHFTTETAPPPPPPQPAATPAPSNNASDVSITTDLAWEDGGGATSYDVYFGTSNPPPFQANTALTTYDPGTLSYGTTYFWRIDSVNAGGTTTGTLWRFTTAPPSAPDQAVNVSPEDNATDVSPNADLVWQDGGGALHFDVYFGTTTTPSYMGGQTATTFDPGILPYNTSFYWRIDSVNVGGTTTGELWSFTTGSPVPPSPATNPDPPSGTRAVSITPDLTWSSAEHATSYEVHFGIDDPPPLVQIRTSPNFDPGRLPYSTTYYWRVDAIGDGGTTPGEVWNFTTSAPPLTDPFPPSISPSFADGLNGLTLNGIAAGTGGHDFADESGRPVASAGDVNGDGYDDVVVGAQYANPNGLTNAGESYVIFGGPTLEAPLGELDLSSLDGSNGFVVQGILAEDTNSSFVGTAGDVNGDGFSDVFFAAMRCDANGTRDGGECYVLFGGPSVGVSGAVSLDTLDGTSGFVVRGLDLYDCLGEITCAGDVNGDGIDDIIIGAQGGDPNGLEDAGETYVLFGSPAIGMTGTVDLRSLNGDTGFVVNGANPSDGSGFDVTPLVIPATEIV